jgi:hypothetical protein
MEVFRYLVRYFLLVKGDNVCEKREHLQREQKY